MKFSTETLEQATQILVAEFETQIQSGMENIEQLERELRQSLHQIGRTALGEMLSVADEQKHGVHERCACGGKLKRTERRAAKLLSVFGWIDYRRGYYRCSYCGRRTALLDENQGLKPGEASQGMAKLMALAGISVSFSEASKQLKEYLLVSVSANTIRKETLAAGERQAELEAQMKAKSEGAGLQQHERELTEDQVPAQLYCSIDGVQTPLEEGWREMKLLSWYRTARDYASKQLRAIDMRYHGEISPADEFGQLFWASGVEVLADKVTDLIFVCDGAAWIWKLVDQYFPQAVQIADWYHVCQYLFPIADAVFGSQTEANQQWVKQVKDLLWEGEVDAVMDACREYQHHPTAQDAVSAALTYFANNAQRMDYQHFRKAGYLIGSGTIESACKQIVSLRLKRAGARWSQRGADATAKARSAWLSGINHWNALFVPNST